jgi:uncharacterized protein
VSEENVRIVRSAYEAFARGDIEEVLAAFHPEVIWEEPQGTLGAFGERVLHGMDEVVAEIFMRLPEVWEDLRIEPARYLDAGDVIVMQGQLHARVPGSKEAVASPVAHICDVRDGKIVHWQGPEDTRKLQQARDRARALIPRPAGH